MRFRFEPVALAGALAAAPLAAGAGCLVGDMASPPALSISEAPPACCFGSWAGTLRGTATNVATDDVRVVVYARTDLHYVQPYLGSALEVGCSGLWSTPTRGGERYSALLVRATYVPPPTLASLPPVGGDVLAVATWPGDERRLEFAGRTWIVKSNGEVPFGPGPNLWSDAAENVWVDAEGRLHLRICERDGAWYCAEVFSEEYCGYGRYRFAVDGDLDALDPNAVFAGFLYSESGDELDVEFSRWGDPLRLQNAQFAVQPNQVHGYALKPPAPASEHEFVWESGRATFVTRDRALQDGGQTLAAWVADTGVPVADDERMRFNLWLLGDRTPWSGQEIEVVVRAFEYEVPTDVAALGPRTVLRLLSPNPVSGAVDFGFDLARSGRVVVEVYDVRGRRLSRAFDRELARGAHRAAWDPSRLASGVYWLSLTGPDAIGSLRFVRP